MKVPLVSIGLPVYNGGRFLAQALDSLLGQTLADFELIVSDNESTDRTVEICLAYAARDGRIRYIRQATNIGPPRNWNFVALQARGQYFKWASANDFCDPQMLEKCVGVMSSDPAVVLCHGRTCIVDEETDERTPFAHDISATDPRPGERFRSVARSIVLNNALSGVIRLDALRRTRLIPLYLHGDLVLTAELALHGHLVLLPETLFYRRIGRDTSSMQLKPADLHAFFYPGSTRRPHFERWRRRIDYSRAVLRAPIRLSEKVRMFALGAVHYAGWAVPRGARQLIRLVTCSLRRATGASNHR
jgi:glycosyltransferase involved in cell wall biosynthesis